MNPPERSLGTITLIPLLGEAEDPEAARWLRGVANPAARQAFRVAVMPLSGIRFFEATGEAARQLDLIWAQAVPAETTPVVVTLHHPALPGFLDGLDAAFVVGMAGGDRAGLYAGRPNVKVIGSGDPRVLLLAAARTWNDPEDPAFLLPPNRPAPSLGGPSNPDRQSFRTRMRTFSKRSSGTMPSCPSPAIRRCRSCPSPGARCRASRRRRNHCRPPRAHRSPGRSPDSRPFGWRTTRWRLSRR